MKLISHKDIEGLNIPPVLCVEWIMRSFSLKSSAQLPAKISVHPKENDFFTSMPCLLPEINDEHGCPKRYFGIKEVHKLGGSIPSLGSDMLLYDANNGNLLALIDCDWITAMRTGAVAAATAKVLRKTSGFRYGFIGLGNTARATLLCVLDSEPESFFYVKLLRYKDQSERFIERFSDYSNVAFDIVDDINYLVENVDVFFSCITSADGPLFSDDKVFRSGVTVIPVHMRGLQVCDRTFDRVFGDDTDHIKNFKFFHEFNCYNEIGEVLAGIDPGRTNDDQRIIAYNYGIAMHDVYFAMKIFNLLEHNIVQEITYDKVCSKFWV